MRSLAWGGALDFAEHAPLAALTGLARDARFGPDRKREAASAIVARRRVGLVAWKRRRIGDLVEALTGGTVSAPH